MSTAAIQVRTGVTVVMNQPSRELKPELQEIVTDLLALKAMARDGILTHHSQRELVKHLSPQDLAAVARVVREEEKREQPLFQRSK